jgi:hypothetical protein
MRRYLEAIRAGIMASVVCSFGLAAVYVLADSAMVAADQITNRFAAAEDVQPHSVCALWGQQILEGNVVRSALYQEQFSRYSQSTNRCFVEMRVQAFDADKASDRFGQYLYDGQTKEMLAFAQIQNGKKSGRVFDLYHRTTSFENAGWDDARKYIYTMMADDWR